MTAATRPQQILIVDDAPLNIKVLETLLSAAGYAVMAATSGREALNRVTDGSIDLVLLDIMMPEMDGYEVCRRLRADDAACMLPIIMLTSSHEAEKVKGLEAGADDFIGRPFDRAELLARVRSLLRVKEYHDQIEAQTIELAEWNSRLESRVEAQVEEIKNLGRLQRFLSPQVAELVLSSGDANVLASHRRDVAVVFCALRGFTALAELGEPEDVMEVLQRFHGEMGEVVFGSSGTLERFVGGGLMVLFNDPIPCDQPAVRAVSMALEMRDRSRDLVRTWHSMGFELDFTAGITRGHATIGQIGFQGRLDYGATGIVTDVAMRLSEEAGPSQILVTQRVATEVADAFEVAEVGDLLLRGLSKPTAVSQVFGLRRPAEALKNTPELPITSREQEVTALIARGLSNREIASALVITEGTAANHVEHILRKLGYTSRAQVAAWAVDHGLAHAPVLEL